jgi:hypothetical protein
VIDPSNGDAKDGSGSSGGIKLARCDEISVVGIDLDHPVDVDGRLGWSGCVAVRGHDVAVRRPRECQRPFERSALGDGLA